MRQNSRPKLKRDSRRSHVEIVDNLFHDDTIPDMSQEIVEVNVYRPLERLDRLTTMTSLTIPEGIGFDFWSKLAEGLNIERKKVRNGTTMFYLGDWLNYGETHLRDRYAEALEVTGYNKQTLYNAKYVAASIEPSRRNPELSWSHHLAVAPLEKEEQDRMLAWAAEKNLTTIELRKMINHAKGAPVEVESRQVEGNGYEEVVGEAPIDVLKRLIPVAQTLCEEFFALSQAFIATVQETGEIKPEHVANFQATAKSLSDHTDEIFGALMDFSQ